MARKIRKDIKAKGLKDRIDGKGSARKIRKDAGGEGIGRRLLKGT